MEDSQIDKLFAGDLENLPPWRQPLIRLYLSSTYTDMTLEKTALFAEVYPKLKEYCREKYGLEFQVSPILTLELSIRDSERGVVSGGLDMTQILKTKEVPIELFLMKILIVNVGSSSIFGPNNRKLWNIKVANMFLK